LDPWRNQRPGNASLTQLIQYANKPINLPIEIHNKIKKQMSGRQENGRSFAFIVMQPLQNVTFMLP
jgi:hypothetical protein